MYLSKSQTYSTPYIDMEWYVLMTFPFHPPPGPQQVLKFMHIVDYVTFWIKSHCSDSLDLWDAHSSVLTPAVYTLQWCDEIVHLNPLHLKLCFGSSPPIQKAQCISNLI